MLCLAFQAQLQQEISGQEGRRDEACGWRTEFRVSLFRSTYSPHASPMLLVVEAMQALLDSLEEREVSRGEGMTSSAPIDFSPRRRWPRCAKVRRM